MRRALRIGKKAILVQAVVVALMMVMAPLNVVRASSPALYDPFNTLVAKFENPDAYWWVANHGENDGGYYIWEDYCGNGSCVLPGSSNGVKYVDLSLTTDTVEGFYTNAELSEQHSGWEYGVPGRWFPANRKSVTVEARVKWVGDYKQDGSGSAIGTSGVWLWNSPLDLMTGQFNSVKAFGFSYQKDDSAFGAGLAAMIIQDNMPTGIHQPTFNVNMNNWVTLKMKWTLNCKGEQYVSFYVNHRLIGSQKIETPFDQGLSLEIWNDNQTPQWDGTVLFRTPVEDQHFLVDYVKVTK